MRSKGGQKVQYLEGLRGFAALMVVLYHFFAIFYPVITSGPTTGISHSGIMERLFFGPPLGFIQNGSFAVVIFFLLSGFVLSLRFFRGKPNDELINQSLRRYIRLGVPVFCSVTLAYMLMYMGWFKNQEVALLTGSIHFAPLWNFQPNFAQALYSGVIGVFATNSIEYNPVLWTMSIELIGSFLVFFFLALFGRYRHRWLFYAFIMIFLWGNFLSLFLLGVIMCDLASSSYFDKVRAIVSRTSTRLILVVLVILGGSVPAYSQDIGIIKYSQAFTPYLGPSQSPLFWHSLAAISLLLLVLTVKGLQRALGSRFGVYLGKISFGLYVLHYFVYGTVTSYLFLWLHKGLEYWQVTLVCLVVSIPIIILAATVWERLIDRRAVVMSKLFAGKFAPTRP